MITDINSEDRLVQQTFADYRPSAIGSPARLITASAESSSFSQGPDVTPSHSTT